jgi:hypothetical protein
LSSLKKEISKQVKKSDYTPACPALGRDRLPAGRQGAGRQGFNTDYTDRTTLENLRNQIKIRACGTQGWSQGGRMIFAEPSKGLNKKGAPFGRLPIEAPRPCLPAGPEPSMVQGRQA